MSAVIRRPLRLLFPILGIIIIDLVLFKMGAYSFSEQASTISSYFEKIEANQIPMTFRQIILDPIFFMVILINFII